MRKDEVVGRAAAAVVTPRAELPKRMIQHARHAISTFARSLDVEALGANLSSACSCLFLPAPTTNLPSTAPEVVCIARYRWYLHANDNRPVQLELLIMLPQPLTPQSLVA